MSLREALFGLKITFVALIAASLLFAGGWLSVTIIDFNIEDITSVGDALALLVNMAPFLLLLFAGALLIFKGIPQMAENYF